MNNTELLLAFKYRELEVPFKVYNVPQFTMTSEKWTFDYLLGKMQLPTTHYHVKSSKNNHFMYYRPKASTPKDQFTNPHPTLAMNFSTWYGLAQEADRTRLPPNQTHIYFTIASGKGKNHFLLHDMPAFKHNKDNLFVFGQEDRSSGSIQCR